MNNALIRELFFDNAMLEESRRMWRKWVAGGSKSGRVGNYVAIGAVIFVYLWGLVQLTHIDYDFSIALEYFALILITVILPTSIYGAIAGERERATWDALILTRLTAAQIIVGKLGWRMVGVAAILLLAWPAMVLTHGRGSFAAHTSFAAMFSTHAMLFAWGILLCAFGLYISACSKNSVAAAGAVFGLLLGLLLLLPIVVSMFNMGGGRSFSMTLSLSFNPFAALAEVGRTEQSTWDPFFWYGPKAGWILTATYALTAAALLALTHRRLKRLEEPQRRSG
jgi:ABC-type transport system involved in multi-copper enzyme maturation permease subunit